VIVVLHSLVIVGCKEMGSERNWSYAPGIQFVILKCLSGEAVCINGEARASEC